ncbi:6-phosphogluconate dehydrogenase [Branchiibius hedensis]|uniref:6-phosphogluconate dehydrogenase n=1 Tax=Branchiibius hedensis TaxID=672460 RepID=A0A2Y8ZW87_9MICO|nr:decarboxylating 6-phosphogluconate dehydrogenase [Branchiibius hedensis]PWJ26995.1 6-phosphogluconate dehydrogenase [Branchiibius hedensis]SSA35806.1 6-phosphogluconate dehydrogenase [Branchiibius hedensis]
MQIGLIGLGKMGGFMRDRIVAAGHEVVGYDTNPQVSDVATVQDLVTALTPPRVVWLMVPAGRITQSLVDELGGLLDKGDLVIDGGNSKFTDDAVHAEELGKKGIEFVDCGVSGGVWGKTEGYGLMAGGSDENIARVMPIFDALRPEGPRDEGFVHAGDVGAGHYVKMVHNGIEYGMMQAYAEGYELLEAKEIVKDVPAAFKAWTRGTVVRSWLQELMADALAKDATLEGIEGFVNDSGEGRWTVQEAVEYGVPMPVISSALYQRFFSRQGTASPAMKAVAALRNEFGGHEVTKKGEKPIVTDH